MATLEERLNEIKNHFGDRLVKLERLGYASDQRRDIAQIMVINYVV